MPEWLARQEAELQVHRASGGEVVCSSGLEAHPPVVLIRCNRQEVIDHRPTDPAPPGLHTRVHRFDLDVNRIQPFERSDAEKFTSRGAR